MRIKNINKEETKLIYKVEIKFLYNMIILNEFVIYVS